MYPILIKQSESAASRRRIPVWLVDVTDGISPVTAVTGSPYISKNGTSPSPTTNTIVEVDATNMPGLYYIELTTVEADTFGTVLLSFKVPATARWDGNAHIVAFDPYDANGLGLTYVDAAVSSRAIPGDAMALTTAERPTLINALFDLTDGVEVGFTLRQTLRLIAAVLCGRTTGGPASTIFRNMQNTANRVVTQADSDGNRNTISLIP